MDKYLPISSLFENKNRIKYWEKINQSPKNDLINNIIDSTRRNSENHGQNKSSEEEPTKSLFHTIDKIRVEKNDNLRQINIQIEKNSDLLNNFNEKSEIPDENLITTFREIPIQKTNPLNPLIYEEKILPYNQNIHKKNYQTPLIHKSIKYSFDNDKIENIINNDSNMSQFCKYVNPQKFIHMENENQGINKTFKNNNSPFPQINVQREIKNSDNIKKARMICRKKHNKNNYAFNSQFKANELKKLSTRENRSQFRKYYFQPIHHNSHNKDNSVHLFQDNSLLSRTCEENKIPISNQHEKRKKGLLNNIRYIVDKSMKKNFSKPIKCINDKEKFLGPFPENYEQ